VTRTGWVVATVTVVCCLAQLGCTSTGGGRPTDVGSPVKASDSASSPTGTGGTESAEPPSAQGDLQATEVHSFEIPTSELLRVALSSQYVAFAFDPDDLGMTDHLGAVDLETGDLRVVTASRWRTGFISWVAVTGETVVWVDQDRRASTWDRRAKWRLMARDLTGGPTRTLSSSGRRPQAWQPSPSADDDEVVWTELSNGKDLSGGFTIYSWRPHQAGVRARARGVRMVGATERPAGDKIAFLSFHGYDRGYPVSDVTILEGHGELRRLSSAGRAQWLAANGTIAVWAETKDPKRAEFADPFRHLVRPLDGSKPAIRLQRGYTASNVVAGDPFVAWWPIAVNAVIVSASDGATQTKIPAKHIHVPARMAASGRLLAYATQVATRDITVHIVSIST